VGLVFSNQSFFIMKLSQKVRNAFSCCLDVVLLTFNFSKNSYDWHIFLNLTVEQSLGKLSVQFDRSESRWKCFRKLDSGYVRWWCDVFFLDLKVRWKMKIEFIKGILTNLTWGRSYKTFKILTPLTWLR